MNGGHDAEAEEGEGEREGKELGILSLCFCKARHCLLCCNSVETKAAGSCLVRPCVSNTVKGRFHEQ